MIQAALAAASLGMQAYSAFGPKSGPDYTNVTNQFKDRQASIKNFAANLAASRARYMASLKGMYDNAYARFSGNAEAGFAGRGLAVNGGAFASALATKAADYQFEGDLKFAGMEREDLNSVDSAEGVNSGAYMSAISGGPALQYSGDRADMGGFAQTLGRYSAVDWNSGKDTGSAGGPSGYGVEDSASYPRNSFRGNPLDLR